MFMVIGGSRSISNLWSIFLIKFLSPNFLFFIINEVASTPHIFAKFIKVVNLGLFNSVFGGIFGLIKWSLLFIVFVWIVHSIEPVNLNIITNSFMYGFLLDLSEILFNIIENEDEVFLQKFT